MLDIFTREIVIEPSAKASEGVSSGAGLLWYIFLDTKKSVDVLVHIIVYNYCSVHSTKTLFSIWIIE